MTDEPTPWTKNGWHGFISEHRGTPVGLFTLRARKGARVLVLEKLTPEQIESVDPDAKWQSGPAYKAGPDR